MKNDRIKENIRELIYEDDSASLMKNALKELKYRQSGVYHYIISIILALFLGVAIGYSDKTVSVTKYMVELFNGVILSFVAIVVGAYAIFQALLSDDFFDVLLETDNNMLKVSNKSFRNLIIIYLSDILLNVIILIILQLIPETWCILNNLKLANCSASILLVIYIFVNILIMLEFKNFTMNLYKTFNAYNASRGIKRMKE